MTTNSMPFIHPTAKIDPSAQIDENVHIGANVTIGAYSIIGSEVSIGEGTVVKSHVVIQGPTTIGKSNTIYQFASIGDDCQDKKYAGERTFLEIGDNNVIRESVTIHRGTMQDSKLTKIGHDNLFMVNVHVAHDCDIGNHCIFANNATLAGHVKVRDYVIVGGMTAVHQFCLIGEHAMVAGCSAVSQDIPPYVIAQGNHCSPFGVNTEGLKRRQFSKEQIQTIRQAYKFLYASKLLLKDAKEEIERLAEQEPLLRPFILFFEQSTRGIIRSRGKHTNDKSTS